MEVRTYGTVSSSSNTNAGARKGLQTAVKEFVGKMLARSHQVAAESYRNQNIFVSKNAAPKAAKLMNQLMEGLQPT